MGKEEKKKAYTRPERESGLETHDKNAR